MAATLLYGVLAAFVMVLLVGFSRVCLGAHYLSDVLGAAAAGLTWLALTLTAVDTLRHNRGQQVYSYGIGRLLRAAVSLVLALTRRRFPRCPNNGDRPA